MPRTLVIPDIHQNWQWAQRLIDQNPHDRRVFLGDYLDTRDPACVNQAGETASWLRDQLAQENVVGLIGNHDLMYLWPHNFAVRCSGYKESRQAEVAPFREELKSKLQWITEVDDWVLTHAGIHPWHLKDDRRYPPTVVAEKVAIAEQLLEEPNKSHEIIAAGRARGGSVPVGGIVWCDFTREFEHCPGIQQMFGHTIGHEGPRAKGCNWCIDGNQTDAAIIEDSKVEFVKA